MKVSMEWLKDFVDIPIEAEALAEKLVRAGFEVEEIIRAGGEMKNVVLGRIAALDKHPDADKLQICRIDVGREQPVQIVTGADNIAPGDLVPAALDGARLPNGMKIKSGKLRGVVSDGMLCSGEELCLSEDDYPGAGVYGILIMNGESAPLGTEIGAVLGKDDVVLDVGVTANRGDCNSVLGIAREVAAVLGLPLKMPRLDYAAGSRSTRELADVEVREQTLCPRYMAAGVRGVKIEPSAPKIQKRLKAAGLRPVNNIVDITNYVLIELGQPMHAFDAHRLKGKKIIPRLAETGEKIVALDGKEYVLDPSVLVIADAEKPCAVAGVMGGEFSSVHEDTRDIVFESAKFLRDNIRRTSRKLNLRSDSSFRYERGIDTESQSLGMRRALALIDEYGYGEICGDIVDARADWAEPAELRVPCAKIDAILGIEIPPQRMADILNSLQIETRIEAGELVCLPPRFREDIENANDLAEEIIRLYGYDNITCTLLDAGRQTIGGKTLKQRNRDWTRDLAAACGMSETLTYSFITPKAFDVLRLPENDPLRRVVRLRNPLGEELSVMRTTLAYSMLGALSKNVLKSVRGAKLFEIAKVFLPVSEDCEVRPEEREHLIAGMYGEDVSYATIKNFVDKLLCRYGVTARFSRSALPYLHSGRSADIVVGKTVIGALGEAHPAVGEAFDVRTRLYLAELHLDALEKVADFGYRYKEIGKFPPAERDIAVVVAEETAAADLLGAVRKGGGNLLESCEIFDIYRSEALGADKKSVAIKMSFRTAERTLTDEEVAAKIDRILNKLSAELGASLRE